MSSHNRHPLMYTFSQPMDIYPVMAPQNTGPSPESTQGSQDGMFSGSPLFPSLGISPTQSIFAPSSSASPDAALPYSVAMNRRNTSGFYVNPVERAQSSQAAYGSLGPPLMNRNTSHSSEPPMRPRQISTPAPGRHTSHEMTFDPFLVQENLSPDVGMDPQAYFQTMAPNYLMSTGTNLSLPDSSADRPSAPPSMVTVSTVPEMGHPMTRENSFALASPRVDLTRMPSSASYAESSFGHGASNLLAAVGGSFAKSTQPQFSAEEWQTLISSDFAPPMNRVDSTRSTRSTASSGERRAREARERILLAAQSTAIAPMPQPLPLKTQTVTLAKQTPPRVARIKQKPRHAKLLCKYCNDFPEGFRGDHEMRRHISVKHSKFVKKYVCRDPRTENIPTLLQALNPLSQCKACTSGKQYNAYYNAAAHLRRTHFRVKPTRGRGAAAMGEKRGGKGGGDWPSMAELKAWFYEIEIQIVAPASSAMGNDPVHEDSFSQSSDSPVHMDTNVNPFDDAHTAVGDDTFITLPGQFPTVPDLDDIEMFGSSQGSEASALGDADEPEFDIAWLNVHLELDA